MPVELQTTRAAAVIVADDIRDYVRGRARPTTPQLDARQRKVLEELRRDGFSVVEGYWPRERALGLRDRLEPYIGTESCDLSGGAYLRVWDGKDHDQGVRRIYYVDRLLPELSQLRNDQWVLDIVAAYYRIPFHSGLLMFQHNLQTNHRTRFFHVDGFAREFKAFVYLDDVDAGNGPFTYLRGSHRRYLTRVRKQVMGRPKPGDTSFSEEEVRPLASEEVQLCGQAGTLILTDVRGLHRGSPQYDRSRSVLVNYIVKHAGDLELDH